MTKENLNQSSRENAFDLINLFTTLVGIGVPTVVAIKFFDQATGNTFQDLEMLKTLLENNIALLGVSGIVLLSKIKKWFALMGFGQKE